MERFSSAWWVNLADAGVAPGAEVTLRLLPLPPASTIHVPPEAQQRRGEADLLALDAVELVRHGEWSA